MPKPLPGRYNLRTLQIINNNKTLDVLGSFIQEINFYESIYSPTVTGSLVLTDVENFISSPNGEGFYILGNEIIIFEFELAKYYIQDEDGKWSEGLPNLVRFVGRITEVKNRGLINDRSQNYELLFTSEELILDRNLPFSQSYSGMKISDMVNKVLDKLAPLSGRFIQPTKYLYDIIIPYWSPIRAINWLTSRAIPERSDHHPPMLFFQSFYTYDVISNAEEISDNKNLVDFTGEVSSKFYFCSLDWLTSFPPRKTLFNRPSNIDDPGTSQDAIEKYMSFNNVINYNIDTSFDTIQNTNVGMYTSRLISHDIKTKKWGYSDFTYDSSFPVYKHVEKRTPGKLFHGVTDILGNNFSDPKYVNSFLMMAGTGTPESPNHLTEISSGRASRLQSLNYFKIHAKVFGDGLLEVGDVIKFQIPSPEKDAERGYYEKFYSGNYLISAIHHRFNGIEYTLDLELCKESLSEEAS